MTILSRRDPFYWPTGSTCRGKTVLVVGGSSGIGNGIAQAFRRNGAADIAGAVLVLASPHASYVLGHTIPVDGGLIL